MLFLFKKMSQLVIRGRFVSTAASYEDAVRALNTLQTNAEYLKLATSNHSSGSASLQEMKKYLIRSGLTLEDVDKLSIIHVAGTKGKGSTCAFTESILRNHGFRTGFYSSPHLIHVTERIRINGRSIERNHFAKYFWQVYNTLYNQKENDHDMPTYFKFLTILMFHIFLNADIDVVILEVGIGGKYDCTNIVRNPVCVGITSLAMEHTALLGNTLEEIAHQKSGIFKKNSVAFTVPQPDNAMNILKQRAIERECKLYLVPNFKSYCWNGDLPVLGIAGDVQKINASLAIQLAHAWMLKTTKNNLHLFNNKINNSPPSTNENGYRHFKTAFNRSQFNIDNDSQKTQYNDSSICFESQNYAISTTDFQNTNNSVKCDGKSIEYSNLPIIDPTKTALALSSCKWPGRTQVLRGNTMDFYLDGAHTTESIEICTSWYLSNIQNKDGNRYLIFNITGNRDVSRLLKPLKGLQFHRVYFVPNISGKTLNLDQLELQIPNTLHHERCRKNRDIWGEENALALNSVNEALTHIAETNLPKANIDSDKSKPQVLITGSLHLVGAALFVLDPNSSMKTDY